MKTTYANNDLAILARIVGAEQADLAPDIAEGFLRLSFAEDDRRRMNELAERAAEEELTNEEQAVMDSWERVGHLLSLLKSKACRSLKRSTGQL